jgi:hypothetical protein
MTGRAAGFCANGDQPGFASVEPRCGFALRRGGGFGQGWGGRGRFRAPFAAGAPDARRFARASAPEQNLAPERIKQMLMTQLESLQSELDAIKQRLAEIEAASATE